MGFRSHLDGVGTTNNQHLATEDLCPGRLSPPCARAARRRASPKQPKITKTGARLLQDGRRRVPLSWFTATIHSSNVWVACRWWFDPFGLKLVPVEPKISPFGPETHQAGRNRKTVVSQDYITAARTLFPPANPHFCWFPHLRGGFGSPGACLAAFWVG